jgi:hypothetical protein
VSNKAIVTIETILNFNTDLTKTYKQSFIKYIKEKYASNNKEVNDVVFDEKRINNDVN